MTTDPIFNDLQAVMEAGQELEVLNFYHCFPVTCKARVESIDRETVLLKVQPPGSVLLEGQAHTNLLGQGLPEALKAAIDSFDLRSGSLLLRDFTYTGADFGKRMVARVHPENPIPVEIEGSGQPAAGQLVDISLSGIGVQVSEVAFARGQAVKATLALPGGTVALPGKVLNLSPIPGQPAARLSIGFSRSEPETALILHYIKDRRAEILAEVATMYECAQRAQDQAPSE